MRFARLVSLVLVSCLVVVLGVGVTSASAIVDTDHVVKLELGDHDMYRYGLCSSGDLLLWMECVNLDSPERTAVIRDLSTGEEMRIPYGNSADIDDGVIVYLSADGALCALDWATKTTTRVLEPPTETWASLGAPRIGGRDVVYPYYSGPEGRSSIRVVNLDTGKVTNVSSTGESPDIANGWVVWETPWMNGYTNKDIKAYQLSTGVTKTLCSNPKYQQAPSIGENGMVVWGDFRNGATQYANLDVYGCFVTDTTNFPIATGPGAQQAASVEGSLVIYQDERAPGGYPLVGLDRLSGKVFGIAPSSFWSVDGPDVTGIDGGLVAWSNAGWYDDGSDFGAYRSTIYYSRPTKIDVLAGADRFATAVAASQKAFPDGATSAIIASGMSWPDALAGAGLAGTDSPVLLTGPLSLPSVTATELRRLGVTEVTILGGTTSVAPKVQEQIEAIVAENRAKLAPAGVTLAVTRIAGADRYETAELIAERIAADPTWDGTVIVATGASFADALAVSPISASAGLPVVLSTPSGLATSSVEQLAKIGAKRAVILGGTRSVPQKAADQLASVVGTDQVTRLSGADRYAASAAIATFGVAEYGLEWDGLGIASGSAFADAMAGGMLKGSQGKVMLLTDGTSLSGATSAKLTAVRGEVDATTYIGGTATLTKRVRGQVRSILH